MIETPRRAALSPLATPSTAAELVEVVLAEDALSPLSLVLPVGAVIAGLDVLPRMTASFKGTLKRMDYAVRRGSPLALIVGTHGGGKSTAARIFVAGRKNAIYWEARPGYNERHLMNDLCQMLNISASEGFAVRTQVVIDHLRNHPRILIIDEAQRLNYSVMDQLKFVADNTKSTVILVGSPWLEQKVDRHSDISSRVWVRGRVEPLGLDEFRRLYAEEGYSPAALDELHALSGGVLRVLTALLTHLDAALTAQDTLTRDTLTVGHIRKAAETVL